MINDQSVENAVVAFVKGANEKKKKNEFFEKVNKEFGPTRQRINNFRDELIWG